jgi:signal transduction histidine kinase
MRLVNFFEGYRLLDRVPKLLFALAVVGALAAAAVLFAVGRPRQQSEASLVQMEKRSLSVLEQRVDTIDQQLLSLAKPSMRTGVGAVGYRSVARSESAHPEWIQIDFSQTHSIDQVVLVPTIWRDTVNGFRADGFPLEFCLRVGWGAHREGKVVARFTARDRLLPRVAPVVVSFPAMEASWVRLEASRLSPRGWDGMHLLQLSEILVFSGQENVALGQTVLVSSSNRAERGLPRHEDYLVDGFVPYLMDAYEGKQSLAYVSGNCIGTIPILTIDLGRPVPINRIHLHATELSDNVPQALPNEFGIPRKLVIEGAMESGFGDPVRLCEYKMESIYDAGPIIMRRFNQTRCRYVRLIVTELNRYSGAGETQARIGLAEIEIFSNGVNVALDRPVSVNLGPNIPGRSATTLTDGNNLFGEILPIRQWIAELAVRHDLETERPFVAEELTRRYQRQRTILVRLSWLAALLGFTAVCTILVERTIRQRAVFQTRERIAADLHDELGANLHAIGLLGDLAQAASNSPDRMKSLLQRVRALTERSGAATRYCSNLLESEGLFGDLMEDMRRTSGRLMADLNHELTFEGEAFIRELKPRVRIDLFLFYKECLTNILRHSHATHVVTHLNADRNGLCLRVIDDGCGLDETRINRVPMSLNRRARLINATVTADQVSGGGTRITLKLRTRRFGLVGWGTKDE